MKKVLTKATLTIIPLAITFSLLNGCVINESTAQKSAPDNKFWVEQQMRKEMKKDRKNRVSGYVPPPPNHQPEAGPASLL